MKKIMLLLALVFQLLTAQAQELFVLTEPASNMPAKSLGLRLMNSFMQGANKHTETHLMPEIMWGATKKWMFHANAFISNQAQNKWVPEGAGMYAKYRFYSADELHKHLRLAAFARLSYNNAMPHQQEIETMGHNSGAEIGLIATKLHHKIAYNLTLSTEHKFKTTYIPNSTYSNQNSALNYTLSVGKLVYPKQYTNFNKTNINLMLECIGQRLPNGNNFIDLAPAIQFIIKSQARIDLLYRQQIHSTMYRIAPNGFILKFEYTFFNVLQNRNPGKL
jgi:hypothetical protein